MKVKCLVKNRPFLTVGQEYQVLDSEDSPALYMIAGDDGGTYYCDQEWFELLPTLPIKKAICKISFPHLCFIGNKVYEVYDSYDVNGIPYYNVKNDLGQFINIDSFYFVDIVKPIEDEETKYRRLLSPTILPHECACGIARVDCSYHK